jgi:hypothetical protein
MWPGYSTMRSSLCRRHRAVWNRLWNRQVVLLKLRVAIVTMITVMLMAHMVPMVAGTITTHNFP